jgi:hypothetical protein
MKTNRSALVRAAIMIAIIALASIILVGSFAAANSPWGRPEIWDIDVLHQRDPAQTEETSSIFGTSGLPLTAHFDIKPVMAFDPWAGDLVDPNFNQPAPIPIFWK